MKLRMCVLLDIYSVSVLERQRLFAFLSLVYRQCILGCFAGMGFGRHIDIQQLLIYTTS